MAFTGGYTFKHFEGAAEPVLRDIPLPERITVSFCDTAPIPRRLLVEAGASIRAGEPLFTEGDDECVFPSPVGGAVEKAGDEGIAVRSDGDPSCIPVSGHPRAPWHMDRASALKVFRTSGCSLLFEGRFVMPRVSGSPNYALHNSGCLSAHTRGPLDPAALDSIRHIIVNAVHNAPLDREWKPNAFGDTDLFHDGIRTLKTLFPGSDITIATNRRNRVFFECPEIAEHAILRIASDRWPQEFPDLLSRDIHGVKPGTLDPSVLVAPFEEIIQASECMTRGRPLIDRIILVAGPGVSKPGWYRIRIGTPFAHISRHLLKAEEFGPWRIIRGGILTGRGVSSSYPTCASTRGDPNEEELQCSDHEITVIREHASRDLYRFLNPGFAYDSYARVTMSTWLPLLKRRLDSSVHGGVRPCVQCNFCDEVCPVGIYPHLIWKQVSAGFIEESFRLQPHRCVGCGLCDYVCPSKIDISQAVRSARAEYLNRHPELCVHNSGTPKGG